MNWRLTFLLLTALFFTSCQTNEAPPVEEKASVENSVSGDFTISILCEDDICCDSLETPTAKPVLATEVKPPKPKYASVNGYLKSFRKSSQSFVEDASENIKIRGREGTEVAFAAGTLVLADGRPVTGKVTLKLEEYYHTADIVKARLTTQSDKGLLETAGMINLKVTADGQECKLKSGQKVEIAFAGKPGKGMKLFDGRITPQGDMEWVEQSEESGFGTRVIPLLSEREFVFMDNFVRDISKRVYYPKAAMSKRVEGTVYITFFFDSDGKLRRPRIVRGDDNLLAKSVLYTFNNYPEINLEDYDGVPVNRELTMPIRFKLKRGANLDSLMPDPETEKAIAATELVRDENGGAIIPGCGWMVNNDYEVTRVFKSKTNNMLRNSFKSVSLGWINCDRFLPEEPRTDIYVSAMENEDLFAYLVFKDINSVMSAYNLAGQPYFGNVPLGHKAGLVVVKVDEEGEMKFAFQDVLITENMNISGLHFENLSKTEFTQRLNGLSGSVAMVQ